MVRKLNGGKGQMARRMSGSAKGAGRGPGAAMASDASRMVRVFSLLALLAMVAMLVVACGEEDAVGSNGSGGGSTATPPPVSTPTPPPATPTPLPIAHPTGDQEVIIRIEYTGGFVMQEYLVTRLPLFLLTGDGCIVTEGPQIEIYPQPALPNLLETCVNEEGIQLILKQAEAAGLLDGNAQYDLMTVADASTTVFTVTANGTTTVVSAYALGMDEVPAPDATPAVTEAREKLAAFMAKLSDLKTLLPASAIVSEEQSYDIERLQLVFLPADAPNAPIPPDDFEVQELEWPLVAPLSGFGTEYAFIDGSRCGVVQGADLAPVLEQLQDANQLTRWTSDGEEYVFLLRPLLAGEQGCQDPVVG